MTDYEYVRDPIHYAQFKYEPWDVIKDWGLDFDLGSVVKYVSRAGKKPDNSKEQDLRKAMEFLKHAIDNLPKEIDEGYME